MSILSGLEQYGLKNLENASVIMEDKEKTNSPSEAAKPLEVKEIDLIFDKTHVCPVCGSEFKSKTLRVGKTKLVGTDLDLRPKYDPVDSLKYDVLLCPVCGYAALSRYFKFITGPQAQLIKNHISINFRSQEPKDEVVDYDMAIDRYKLALANSIVKRSRTSERGYICLKMAWVIRGKMEHLDQKSPSYEADKKKCTEDEEELLKNSLECFLAARQSEAFPMCGMDEATVDYLISVMSLKFGQRDVAMKLISNLLISNINPRMKDKARNLKEIALAEKKRGGA